MSADATTPVPAAWEVVDGAVLLRVGSCPACGHRFHPPQDYGCERCGAPGSVLTGDPVPATGRVRALVGVQRPDFTVQVGEVRLAGADVVVRAPVAAGVAVGDDVAAVPDEQTPPLVFSPAGVAS